MLEDIAGIRRVIVACGTVDLRKGIDGFAQIIGSKYELNPFEKD
ncbi:IS66 family insertion sequence element accessory protein TnpB [Ruminiclostridium cellobioparum]|nr:IS66 family insertion sequence element accessory protein TnpB [Ruminiclostridium cellobioparum]